MKERYRSMMEQAVLSEGTKADLLEKLEQKCPARKGARILRAALIAACACVVLIGGAFAAEFISNAGILKFGELKTPEIEIDIQDWDGYKVRFETLKEFSLDEFSEEFTAWHANMKATGGENELDFESWDELEQFLGIEMMNNPILEKATKWVKRLDDKNGDPLWESHCRGGFGGRGVNGQFNVAVMSAFYECLGGDVEVTATIHTEAALQSPDDSVYGRYYKKGTEFVTEQYVAPSGLAATIVKAPNGRFADFTLNGVAFCVQYTGPVDSDALYQILDAFEF